MGEAEVPVSTRDRVVELLNKAAIQESEKDRIESLCKVQELIIHFESTLLDSFFDEAVAFQSDKNSNVRKFVVGFIEEACKKDNAMLPRLVPNLELLLLDDAIAVVKRVVQTAALLHRWTLAWLSSAGNVTPEMEQTWAIITRLKTKILTMLDHDNDGVRTQVIKFLECVILTQTYLEKDSLLRTGEFNLDQVPLTVKVIRPRKMEEESRMILGKFIHFQGSLHISSVNLMTCMSSLSIIARSRPQFMARVIEALEILHANLPPTLTTSQVNSVRKHLKFQFLNLLKHSGSYDFQENILNILNDLGVTQHEINRSMPSKEDVKKRVRRNKGAAAEEEKALSPPPKKKICYEGKSSSGRKEPSKKVELEPEKQIPEKCSTAVDITQQWLVKQLSIETVTQLVMVSMLNLPEKQPSLFSASYTPVTNSGSSVQINHLARLLASQLTAAGCGPGMQKQEEEKQLAKEEEKAHVSSESEEEEVIPSSIKTVESTGLTKPVAPPTKSKEKEKAEKEKVVLLPSGVITGRPAFQKSKFVKLNELTKPLSWASNQKLQVVLLKRVLSCDKTRLYGGAHKVRMRILARFATIANAQEMTELENFIFTDLNANSDILLSWLFASHAATQDFLDLGKMFQRANDKVSKQDITYETVLTSIIRRIMDMPSNKERNEILTRTLLKCPSIQLSALNELLVCSQQGDEAILSVTSLIKDLTIYRPNTSLVCLPALSELLVNIVDCNSSTIKVVAEMLQELMNQNPDKSTPAVISLCHMATHSKSEVRDVVHPILVRLHSKEEFKSTIIGVSKRHLGYLMDVRPPTSLFTASLGRSLKADNWDDEASRACLYTTLVLLPHQHDLIHYLSEIYVKTLNEAKRAILRLLEIPISSMGMESPTLLKLVEECPKGSETLITRIIHILTEKAPPSDELVCHVRDLYNKRVSDVRFLIPVLTGLTKKEVIAVLPKLIQLNPHVVKEVFNRLWGVTLDKGRSPLTPIDLLVALHLISSEKCNVKIVIKATGVCFSERNIYTAEVLASSLQQLVEETPLPTLFMRTVIQSLTHHPKLLSFIINILQRLVSRQIWNEKKAWEGFIRCCQRSVPQSFTVLLQLPNIQLAEILNQCSDLHKELSAHIAALAPEQLEHIPSTIRDVIRDPSNQGIKLEPDFEIIVEGEAI